jgi:hypothetical protein
MADFALLDERTEVEFSERHQTYLFAFDNNTAYTTYRFEFETELVAGGPLPGSPNSIQLAEVELFENMTFPTATYLVVNRGNGNLTITNFGATAFSMVGYSITSPHNKLNSSAYLSIAENYDGNDGAELDADIWLRLSPPGAAGELSEVENPDGADGVLLAPGQSIDLGNAWIPSAVEDLLFEVLTLDGSTLNLAVAYDGILQALPGDFDRNQVVNGLDLGVWRSSFGQLGANLPADGDADGDVDGADFFIWQRNLGATAPSSDASSASVPEPASWLLATLLPAIVLATRRRPSARLTARTCAALAAAIPCLLLVSAASASTIDRNYQFGDDAQENAVVGQTVGQASVVPNFTLDSASQGSFFDLAQFGGPTYASMTTTSRPGAGVNSKGIQFTGSSSQYLSQLGFGAPREGGALSNPQVLNYADSRIMQVWVRPTLNTGARQDIVNDTFQFGIHITAAGTWGHTYGATAGVGNVYDTGAPVAFNQWTHVVQQTIGRTGVAVFVNGVAVSRLAASYLETTAPADNRNLYVGAGLGAAGSFFTGQLDNLKIAVAGTFFLRPPSEPIPVQWGPFNMAVENEYVATRNLAAGDVNGDGVVNGTGAGPAATDDVRFFIDHWLDERTVNNFVIGDLTSRTTLGDLNFDGRTNLDDWAILRNAHVGGESLNLAALLAEVPEPSTWALALALSSAAFLRRRTLRQ